MRHLVKSAVSFESLGPAGRCAWLLAAISAYCAVNVQAVEFEVADDLRVNGYSAMLDSAAVLGNYFSVGGSTFTVFSGRVGIGTVSPGYLLHVSSGPGVSGNLLVISTGASNVIRMTGNGDLYANKYYGDISGSGGISSGGDSLGSHTATKDLSMAGFDILNAGAGTFGGALTVNGSSISVTGKDAASGYSLLLSSGLSAPSGTVTAGYAKAVTLGGDGARLTALNASVLASGTVDDARLSPNVELLNAPQPLSGGKTFTSSVTVTEALGVWTPAVAMRAGVFISSAPAAQGGGVYVSSNIYAAGLVRSSGGGFKSFDAAYGKTPTVVGTWSTSPASLTNATDGSLSTGSGTGVSTQTSEWGSYLKIDLGAKYRGLLFLQGGVWNGATGTTANMSLIYSLYSDFSVITYGGSWGLSNDTTEGPVFLASEFYGQYLAVTCYTGNSSIAANCVLYDITAAVYQ